MKTLKAILVKDRHIMQLFIIFVAVFAVMSALKPGVFLSVDNFRSMSEQFPELGFLSIAAALALMSGGIDLSVMGTASLSGITAAVIMQHFGGADGSVMVCAAAIVTAVIVGGICGSINAVLIAVVGITPMLATLGTMNLFTGIGVVLTKGSAISGFPAAYVAIGNGRVFGVPVQLILFIIAIVLMSIILKKTKLGFKLYVYGTNPIASFYSAIRNSKVVFSTYVVSGLVSSLAGIIMVSRINTAKADFGTSYGLQALLVAVLGGINPSGGGGNAVGILLSIVTLQMISSGFNLMHVSSFLKDFSWGILLVGVMVLNTFNGRWRK